MAYRYNLSDKIQRIDEWTIRIPRQAVPGMQVDGIVFADEALYPSLLKDDTLSQVVNVAMLPGLAGPSLAMPDAHQGYGFCIGGVAATNLATGVVSAGGVGFDINCGVRLLASSLEKNQVGKNISTLIEELYNAVPAGAGVRGRLKLSQRELRDVLDRGASWAVSAGYGDEVDVEYIEEQGRMTSADPDAVSDRAFERGKTQVGTLGSGNHFLEIQYVEEIFDPQAAETFGLHENQIVVLIHSGSRGLGHQVCSDAIRSMDNAIRKYGITVPDRQLACVPIASEEGKQYLGAMAAAANFAFANRQCMTHWTREVFTRMFPGSSLRVVYDVCHNIAKIEEHVIDGQKSRVLVHRKGATRAFPENHPDIPARYRSTGQPVLIPGSMGTASYVLAGLAGAMERSFGSCCHGAGRLKSRTRAKKETNAKAVLAELHQHGIVARSRTREGLTEENPSAYKNVTDVVDVVHHAGLARKVAKLIPIGVIKG
ncbi:MAG: RtcB family protein [Chlorobi bacterium]|nr:RtcB family protein [Chlorobiota bacterium]